MYQLDKEVRTHVPTLIASVYLNKPPETLRAWAFLDSGPIRPLKVDGRLAWPVKEIKTLLNKG